MHFAYFYNMSIKAREKLRNFPTIANVFFNVNIKMGTYQQNFPYNKSFNGVLDT